MRTAAVLLATVLQLALTTASPASRRSIVYPGQLTVDPETPCQEFEHHYCNLFGYNFAKLPNFKNQDASAATTEFLGYEPLLYTSTSDGELCSDYLGTVLCFYYFPLCRETNNVNHRPDSGVKVSQPCRNTCLLAKEGCAEYMVNGEWPEHLDCSQFPEASEDPLCVFGVQVPYQSRTGTKDPDPEDGNSTGSGAVFCDPPSDPSSGRVSYSNTTAGSEATYSCNAGYQLNGESIRTCQDDGQWSGSEPSCEPVLCDPPSDPSNGIVLLEDTDTTVGSEATYSCNEGYQLNGESIRTCQDDGQWSGSEPSCELRECPEEICPRCNMRTRCNSNTFKRNGYTFAARVTVLRIKSNTACNRSYEVRVNEQFDITPCPGVPTCTMPTGPGTQIQIDTTSGFGCAACPSGEHEVQVNTDYLFAGYCEESPLRWYLDSKDSLTSSWEDRYRNMDSWVKRRTC